jgi:hypothetical protein
MFNACAVTLAASLHAFTTAHNDAAFAQQNAVVDAGGQDPLEPDRPDVTNGTHIVDVGLLQMEVGGIWNRSGASQHDVGTPTTFRLGLSEWLEARISSDGFLAVTNPTGTARGLGNVQLGAKLRLWADPGGVPVLSILPTVNLPAASETKGLGSGHADFTIAVLTGTDFLTRGHIDVNSGIGRIGAAASSAIYAASVSWSASAGYPDR